MSSILHLDHKRQDPTALACAGTWSKRKPSPNVTLVKGVDHFGIEACLRCRPLSRKPSTPSSQQALSANSRSDNRAFWAKEKQTLRHNQSPFAMSSMHKMAGMRLKTHRQIELTQRLAPRSETRRRTPQERRSVKASPGMLPMSFAASNLEPRPCRRNMHLSSESRLVPGVASSHVCTQRAESSQDMRHAAARR